MMSVLSRYLCRLFLLRFILLLIGISGAVLSFELLETGDNILNRTTDGDAFVLVRYGLLRLPDLAARLLPMSALLAAILTFLELSRNRELVAMWVSGMSSLGLIASLWPMGLLLVGLQFGLDNFGVPKTMEEVRAWGVGPFERANLGDETGLVWLKSGQDVIRLPAEAAQAGKLEDLTIFRRDPDGVLIERLDARRAVRSIDGWILSDVRRESVESSRETEFDRVHWSGQLDLESIALIAEEPRELRIGEIVQLIDNEAYGQRRVELYQTWLHYRFVAAFAPFLVLALVVSLSQFFRGRQSLAPLFISSLATGFTFFVFDKASVALGEVALIPYWMAAWAPSLILACLIGTFLLYQESEGRTRDSAAGPGTHAA